MRQLRGRLQRRQNKLQAFAQLNEGYKFKMDLTTNGVVITDAIKFVQTNKEKLLSTKEDDKESKEPDYDEDKDQLGEEREEETEQKATTNTIFDLINS